LFEKDAAQESMAPTVDAAATEEWKKCNDYRVATVEKNLRELQTQAKQTTEEIRVVAWEIELSWKDMAEVLSLLKRTTTTETDRTVRGRVKSTLEANDEERMQTEAHAEVVADAMLLEVGPSMRAEEDGVPASETVLRIPETPRGSTSPKPKGKVADVPQTTVVLTTSVSATASASKATAATPKDSVPLIPGKSTTYLIFVRDEIPCPVA
jgi:hypothetical protein